MKTEDDLRTDFLLETGEEWVNTQGEPDIDYVAWLEKKLLASPSHAAQDRGEGNPLLIDCFADNGEFSHWHLIDTENGKVLWSSFPEETIARGEKIEGYNSQPLPAQDKTPEGVEDAEKLRVLAKWFDEYDRDRTCGTENEVQTDLRRIADNIESASYSPTPTPEGRTAEEKVTPFRGQLREVLKKTHQDMHDSPNLVTNDEMLDTLTNAVMRLYTSFPSRPTQQTPTQEDQMEKSLRLLDKFMKEKPEQFAEIVKRIDALPDTGGPTVKELLQACRQERKEKHKHDCTRPEIVNFDAVSDICLSCGTYYPIHDTGSDRKGESK